MHPAELLAFAGLGAVILIVAWLPLWLERLPLTLPMLAVGAGYLAFLFTPDLASPQAHPRIATVLLEVVLIVAVMGAGLSIDRRFSWRGWGSAWRLLVIVMPLSIAALAALGRGLLGLPLGVAVLLGAILAPTDPVLASSVQVGPPGVGEEGETRFALTSEAGLNDGLALPFLALGAAMTAHASRSGWWIARWFGVEMVWGVAVAAVVGFASGWLLVKGNHLLPERIQLSQSNEGVASVGLAFLVYAAAGAAHAYGFVAVFAAAITLRRFGRALEYAQRLTASARRLERLLAFLVFGLFGGAIASGVLGGIGWREVAFALLALLVVRPIASLLGFAGSVHPMPVRLAVGYFGIRGLGSLYYISYAVGADPDHDQHGLWSITALVVLFSIVLYGVTARPALRLLDRAMGRKEPDG
ncbi:MAG TPA: cation:proton antiporter [Rhodanobacteraceae bacterium]|jgi:NhaP-type Na+/H+ or K+/H+ antiporter|nr:cation:proton antiporter [Rhodanobacteraceae bacterium]